MKNLTATSKEAGAMSVEQWFATYGVAILKREEAKQSQKRKQLQPVAKQQHSPFNFFQQEKIQISTFERMNQINNEMRDLCTELDSLQARALHRVEEVENDFNGVVLQDEVKKNFLALRRLITKV